MIRKITRQHDGVEYIHYEGLSNAHGSVQHEDKNSVLTGIPSITRIKGSYKFGKEVQIQLHAPAGSVITKKRNSEKWDRIEIYLPVEMFEEIFKEMQKDIEEENKPQPTLFENKPIYNNPYSS